MAAADDVTITCTHPGKFYPVEEGKESGFGKDWPSLVGSLLCEECFMRYKDKRRAHESRTGIASHSASDFLDYHCDMPSESKRFNDRPPHGGTLKKSRNRKISVALRHCTFERCSRPDESKNFYLIEEGRLSGGRDWRSLVGRVLCEACYQRFLTKGSLERTVNRPIDVSERWCTYQHCGKPRESKNFYLIERGRTSAGKDWSSLVGKVLCAACYCQFSTKGTLYRNKNPRNVSDLGPPTATRQDMSFAPSSEEK